MAEAAAVEADPIPKQQLRGACSGAPSGDKGKECPQSPDKPEPADGPIENGREEQSQDSKTSEELKTPEDLNESEDPKNPEEEKVEAQTEDELKKGDKDEAKEEELKEEPLGPDDVVCDSCIESPRRALKSCLTCLVSYCEAHLRPHLENPKFQNHRLVEPLRDIERRTCESHNWPLELFCCTDVCCICQDCVTEEHRGHNAKPVVEARRHIEASVDMLHFTHSLLLQLLKTVLTHLYFPFCLVCNNVNSISLKLLTKPRCLKTTKWSLYKLTTATVVSWLQEYLNVCTTFSNYSNSQSDMEPLVCS